MSPAASWALLAAALAVTLLAVVVLARLDRVLDDARERRHRRRARARLDLEAARYARARDAVARQQSKSRTRIGYPDTTPRKAEPND